MCAARPALHLPRRVLHLPTPQPPPPQRHDASRAAGPLPTSHARLSTRQYASAFNQALSFDMSKVTDVRFMFEVRSARALPPPQP